MNIKVAAFTVSEKSSNTQLKYVLTTAWYRNDMYLFLHARIQRVAGGPDPPW